MKEQKYVGREALLSGVRSVLTKQGVYDCGLLVALSGGPDSVALLQILFELRESFGLRLFAVYLNHGIRPEAAIAEEELCRRFCAKREVNFFAFSCSVPRLAAQQGIGLEEAGRRERYRLFETLRRETGAAFLCTAHHAGDSLESQLMHFARGCGIGGLCGIRERQGTLLRPLLAFSKEQLLSFCREEGLPFALDESNDDLRFSRNFVRAKLTPALRALNPEVEKAARQTALLLQQDSDYLDEEAKRLRTLSAEERQKLPDPILSRILILDFAEAYAALYGDREDRVFLSFEQRKDLLALFRGKDGASLSLSGGMLAVKRQGDLHFVRDPRFAEDPAQEKIPLPKPGETLRVPGATLRFEKIDGFTVDYEKKAKKIYKILIKYEPASATINDVYLRHCRKGDTIRLGAMTRTVRELCRQLEGREGIARENLLLLCDAQGPLYLPGFGFRDGADPILFPGELPEHPVGYGVLTVTFL